MSTKSLEGHKYVSVITYRKNGEKVSTPVWFVLKDRRVFVWIDANSGKVRRVRRNAKLALAPCTRSGKPVWPYVEGWPAFPKTILR